jgi:predicted ATP-grasp superfamily ATP-dependent carboligase
LPDLAREAGVHTPALVPPPWTRAALVERLPLVAKPSNGRGGVGVRHLVTTHDVDTHAAHLDPDRDVVMERIGSGVVYGAFALYEGGRCVAQYGHERVRTFPASGGVSTCAVRHDVDGVLALQRAVLDALAWEGLAMIEAMQRDDGALPAWSLIEINPRLWGTILLDEFSGAFLLRNYVRRCLDGPLAPQAPRIGTTFRWAAGEALHAAQTREARALVVNPLDAETCWSGVTYARTSDAARFFARAVVQPSSLAKLKSKWAAR